MENILNIYNKVLILTFKEDVYVIYFRNAIKAGF
jgi:hypothetical protein